MPIEGDGCVVGLHVNPKGGVPKFPVDELFVTTTGCEGDRQNDRKHHGGPHRAVCLMAYELMEELAHEGHPISPGSTGENLLIKGIQAESLLPGTVLKVGAAVLEITEHAKPCRKISASFTNGAFQRLSHKKRAGHTRWYAKVVSEGRMSIGDQVSSNQ